MKSRFLLTILATCLAGAAPAQTYVPEVVFLDGFEPPPAPVIGDLHVTEVMPNPNPPLVDAASEWIEIYSTASRTLLLTGCELRDAGVGTAPLTGVAITPATFLLAARSTDDLANGGLRAAVAFSFVVNDTSETVSVYCDGVLLDQLSYTSSMSGRSITIDVVGTQCNAPIGTPEYWMNNVGTPGAINPMSCP